MKREHKRKTGKCSARKRRRVYRWFIPLIAGLLIASVSGYLVYGRTGNGPGRSFQVQGGETRPVLEPVQFPAKGTRLAYAAARQHREVMDHLYCYCFCDRPPYFHKSLLSCYTGTHAAG